MSVSFSRHMHLNMAIGRRFVVKEVWNWTICGWFLLGRWNLVWQVKMNLCALVWCPKDTCLVKMKIYYLLQCKVIWTHVSRLLYQ